MLLHFAKGDNFADTNLPLLDTQKRTIQPAQYLYTTDSNAQMLLTLAMERYAIHFEIGRKPGHVCIQNNCIARIHCISRERARFHRVSVNTLQILSIQNLVYSG